MQDLITKLGIRNDDLVHNVYINTFKTVSGDKTYIVDNKEVYLRWYDNGHYDKERMDLLYGPQYDDERQYIEQPDDDAKIKDIGIGVLFQYYGIRFVPNGSNIEIRDKDTIISMLPEEAIKKSICRILRPETMKHDKFTIFFNDTPYYLTLNREYIVKYCNMYIWSLSSITVDINMPSETVLYGVNCLFNMKEVNCETELFIQILNTYKEVANELGLTFKR